VFYDETYCTWRPDAGEWQYREVPDGQVICGIGVNTFFDKDGIYKLDFKLCSADNYVKRDRSAEIPTVIRRTLKFDSETTYSNEWPTSTQHKAIKKPMRLNAIRYKHYDNDSQLCGIQLCFTNGYKSHLIETETS
jgi:hypothetical protein